MRGNRTSLIVLKLLPPTIAPNPPSYHEKVFGFIQISQVVLAMAGGGSGVRTPGPPWPAPCLNNLIKDDRL